MNVGPEERLRLLFIIGDGGVETESECQKTCLLRFNRVKSGKTGARGGKLFAWECSLGNVSTHSCSVSGITTGTEEVGERGSLLIAGEEGRSGFSTTSWRPRPRQWKSSGSWRVSVSKSGKGSAAAAVAVAV